MVCLVCVAYLSGEEGYQLEAKQKKKRNTGKTGPIKLSKSSPKRDSKWQPKMTTKKALKSQKHITKLVDSS